MKIKIGLVITLFFILSAISYANPLQWPILQLRPTEPLIISCMMGKSDYLSIQRQSDMSILAECNYITPTPTGIAVTPISPILRQDSHRYFLPIVHKKNR